MATTKIVASLGTSYYRVDIYAKSLDLLTWSCQF